MLEIERDSAAWRSEQYRRLLEKFSNGVQVVGHAVAEPEDGQPVASSSSQSAPATPSHPTPWERHSLMAWQEDDGRERHQRSVLLQYYVFG